VRGLANPFVLLGSKRALNVRTHLVFIVPAFFTAGFFDFERLGGNLSLWLLVAFVGTLATVIPIEALKPLLRQVASVSGRVAGASLVLLIAGLVRGATIFVLGNALGIVPQEDIFYRLLGGPVFVWSYYLVTNAVVEVYLRHREQVQRLTVERQRLERIKSGYTADLRNVNAQQRARVRELLAAPIWELQKKLEGAKNQSELQDALLSIQALNHDVVRPLSHELASTSALEQLPEGAAQSARISPWPKRVALGQVLPPWFYLLVILSTGLNAQIATSGFLSGLSIVAVSLVPILTLFFLERRSFRRITLPLFSAFFLSLSLAALSGVLAGWLAISLGVANTANYWWQAAIYIFITKLLTLVLGVSQLGWRENLKELERVTEQLKIVNSRLRQQLWLGQKSLAMELHGSVQSTLHAQALRLAKLASPDPEQIQAVLTSIRSSLDRIENEDYLAGGTIETLMQELALLWEGTVEINWRLEPGAQEMLAEDLGLARCLFEVIREAVTNSVKHGGAQNIRIHVGLSEHLELAVINDGELLEGQDSYAGKDLIDRLCLSSSLKNTEGGVELRASFALSPQP